MHDTIINTADISHSRNAPSGEGDDDDDDDGGIILR